ncbi:MAG: nuclear transport factor 2 family protein [Thermoanaerobaculia bacterium]|nr:nuclear transport factor 2 family protein [Thermoanaerobaculia bacterium]
MNKRSNGWSPTTKLVILGAGIASVAALVVATAACSTGRRIDMVGSGKDALAKTEGEGKAAMSGPPETIDRSLEQFRELFANFSPEAVAGNSAALYSNDAYFNDGFVELKGAPAIASYFARSAEATRSIDVEIEQITRTDDGVYVRWIMTYTIHYRSMTIRAPGISHLRFTPDGQISYHRDYWDGSGALAEMVPLTGSVLRAIKGRL